MIRITDFDNLPEPEPLKGIELLRYQRDLFLKSDLHDPAECSVCSPNQAKIIRSSLTMGGLSRKGEQVTTPDTALTIES